MNKKEKREGEEKNEFEMRELKKKGYEHVGFPSGHPPQY